MEVAQASVSVGLIHTTDWLDGVGVFAISQSSLQIGWVVEAGMGHEALGLTLVIVRSGTLDFGVKVFVC